MLVMRAQVCMRRLQRAVYVSCSEFLASFSPFGLKRNSGYHGDAHTSLKMLVRVADIQNKVDKLQSSDVSISGSVVVNTNQLCRPHNLA